MAVFSREASDEFNQVLTKQLRALALDIRKHVGKGYAAVLLGGGYGRGEGACVKQNGKEALYNDLDLFLITDRRKPSVMNRLKPVREKWEERLGIDVDIGKPIKRKDLKRLPHELMWYDLFHGCMVLDGPSDLMRKEAPPWLDQTPPGIEALRLMLNKGSGLMQAINFALNEKDPPDADFVRRNYYKCLLAFGDAALLMTDGAYTTELRERAGALKQHADEFPSELMEKIIPAYEKSAAFKERPDTFSKQVDSKMLLTAADIWIELYLLIENRRNTGKRVSRKKTAGPWETVHDYCMEDFTREPQQHRGILLLRNAVKNLKRKKISLKYPREELYRILPLLMEEPKPWEQKWKTRAENFLSLWDQYN